ncbi:unnamed protein product [Spirodela intermedia]|uniref:Uncharacterized protein n=2 Tax=Spirodela intermedia TaxID=51605 RepID=A0ABN7EB26_SPIIN|nr:unnamed protein product [Spirodela intermedia]CAA7407571.1 unnamed protein product [Spirodela intermedia]
MTDIKSRSTLSWNFFALSLFYVFTLNFETYIGKLTPV